MNVRQLQWWTSSFNFLVRDWERTGGSNEPKDPPSSQGRSHADLPRCLLPSPLRQRVVALPLVTPISALVSAMFSWSWEAERPLGVLYLPHSPDGSGQSSEGLGGVPDPLKPASVIRPAKAGKRIWLPLNNSKGKVIRPQLRPRWEARLGETAWSLFSLVARVLESPLSQGVNQNQAGEALSPLALWPRGLLGSVSGWSCLPCSQVQHFLL